MLGALVSRRRFGLSPRPTSCPLCRARRKAWRDALSWLTPAGRARTATFRATLLESLMAARGGTIADIAHRVDCAIVDRALRHVFAPTQGDA